MSSESFTDDAPEDVAVLNFTGVFERGEDTSADSEEAEVVSADDELEVVESRDVDEVVDVDDPDAPAGVEAANGENIDTIATTLSAVYDEFSDTWSTIEEDKARIEAAQDRIDEIDVAAGQALASAAEAIVSTVVEYTTTTVDASPSEAATWTTDLPESAEGVYIWTRTKATRGSGDIVYTSAIPLS